MNVIDLRNLLNTVEYLNEKQKETILKELISMSKNNALFPHDYFYINGGDLNSTYTEKLLELLTSKGFVEPVHRTCDNCGYQLELLESENDDDSCNNCGVYAGYINTYYRSNLIINRLTIEY